MRMTAAPHRHGRRRWVALVVAVLAAASLGCGSPAFAGTGAMPTETICKPADGLVTVHFIQEGTAPEIDGVQLNGFDAASCDGQPVKVLLAGNAAGDPEAPVTEVLTTLDSADSPCAHAGARHAAVITSGTVTLRACLDPAVNDGHGPASIHDATLLRVVVAGQLVPSRPGPSVLGTEAFADTPNARTGDGHSASASLPQAGGPGADWLVAGLIAVCLGAAVLWRAHRPRR